MQHAPAWFARQLAHCDDALAEADRSHTPSDLDAAAVALSEPPCALQSSLFSVPPHAGVATGGQPELPGWRMAASGATETIE